MNKKQQALLKDLATLIAKHDIADWKVIIGQLPETLRFIDSLVSKMNDGSRRRSSTTNAQASVRKRPEKSEYFVPSLSFPAVPVRRQKIIRQLDSKLRDINSTNKTYIYKKLYDKLGFKQKAPVGDDALIRHIAFHLSALSPDDLQRFFETADIALFDPKRDYQRWTEIISSS